MSDNNRDGQSLTVVEFMKATITPYSLWVAIPLAFIALKYAEIPLVDKETSNSIVEWLSMIWPVLPQHHQEIQRVLPSGVDGQNFGPFCLAILVFAIVAIFLNVRAYVRREAVVQYSARDVLLLPFLNLMTIVYPFVSRVKDKPNIVFDFYVDRFGGFYFFETLFPYLVSFTITMSVILAAEIIGHSSLRGLKQWFRSIGQL